ncbi:hypothetical protein [Bacillus sp. B1-b2]|uniref:hypothetical protein n=1 Tax=Bacillus sp. B1-b2 TaxID=2653201 RepID=UPI001262A25A|nr:hypothetical protein [Bacillus sp. B1-b2]KAB7664158.1 hypothetical protein F9279_23165 [Bacillus sp. B1-b2]
MKKNSNDIKRLIIFTILFPIIVVIAMVITLLVGRNSDHKGNMDGMQMQESPHLSETYKGA